MADNKPKHGGNLSQTAIYGKVSAMSQEILSVLFEMLNDSNRNLRFAAAKTLLNKILPDLKSVEVGGALNDDGSRREIPLFVNFGNGFVPANIKIPSASAGSVTTTTGAVQGTDLAPKSVEDNNSNNGVSETVAG